MSGMSQEQKFEAKNSFKKRIYSLENDARICFPPGLPGSEKAAYFPITLYAFATIDYFSGFFAGYNDNRRDEVNVNYIKTYNKVDQTTRIVDFLTKYLLYPFNESKIAVTIFRHKLIHTGEPKIVNEKNNEVEYTWRIGNVVKQHMILKPNEKKDDSYELGIGIFQLIEDLKDGVFGHKGYFYDLLSKNDLQENWLDCTKEFESYKVKL